MGSGASTPPPDGLEQAISAASDVELRAYLKKLAPAERTRIHSLTAPPSATSREKKKVSVMGKKMAYVDAGAGEDVMVFVYGNPTSSYMWRNVMPYCETLGCRIVAPGELGEGLTEWRRWLKLTL